MSVGYSSRNRATSHSSNRSGSRSASSHRGHVADVELGKVFDPCAATGSMFLYAQGTSIVCLHHDTLALDRRFQRHTEDIVFIAVDTASERGAGRLVVSYDVGQTAIVWDIFTGDEIARFASYEHIRVASWMRNGNIAFGGSILIFCQQEFVTKDTIGNSQGNVILFEPSTSEHISAKTIFDPITAIAPAADCQIYALGYANGSIIIAALQPSFTMIHTLTTSRAPSPIVSLAWHGSGSRQKSDMLATQTEDGDLRVWSISKVPGGDPPRVIRILKRSENYTPGPNWLAWSKNGRIVQYSEGETCAWDVRTKHVTYEAVPTLPIVKGLAIHGSTATLFTLGPDFTVQQFDLNPPTMVANKQHLPPIPPPSPPVSIEEQRAQNKMDAIVNVSVNPKQNDGPARMTPQAADTLHPEDVGVSAMQRISNEMDQIEGRRNDRVGTKSPSSTRSRSRTASISSRSTASRGYNPSSRSVASKYTSTNDATTISYGSSVRSGRESLPVATSPSIASSQSSHLSRPSRLRQEVMRSPEENNAPIDLFPYTRARLTDVPYRNPPARGSSEPTPADLRNQMLTAVFGWEGDVKALIQDERSRHVPGSASSIFLSKWLGEAEPSNLSMMADSNGLMSDWMLLTLSQISGTTSTAKMGHAVVQRSLEKRDINSAATILLGLGEENDAVEVYVSHRRYMEAVLLTCLVFPNNWQRQSELVRKWGESAVKNNQQHLAIRCFSCTGVETVGVLTSPRATEPMNPGHSMSSLLSPPLSPPGAKPGRMTTKNSALKLITSFGDKGAAASAAKAKFFGVGDDDRTPMNAAGVTPIAESAISPGGSDMYQRSKSRSRNPESAARTATPGGFRRARLPSIGETPTDVTPKTALKTRKALPSRGDDSNSEVGSETSSRSSHWRSSSGKVYGVDAPLTLSAAKYEPSAVATSPTMSQVSMKSLPAPPQNAFTVLKQESRTRNGSRDRKPDGLQIQWPPMESIITGDYMSPSGSEISEFSESRPHRDKNQSGQRLRGRDDLATPPLTAASLRTNATAESLNSAKSARSPLLTGRSVDKFISSLDEANYYAKQQRQESRRRRDSQDSRSRPTAHEHTGRSRSQSRSTRPRDLSQVRGRSNTRYIKPAKRSPSSPVPMSPEDFTYPSTDSFDDERYYGVSSPVDDRKTRERSRLRSGTSKARAESIDSRGTRRRSPERRTGSRAGSKLRIKATEGRVSSRRPSPDAREDSNGRGRSKSRTDGANIRSPSSPLPMSPKVKPSRDDADGDEGGRRAVERERSRLRSRQRSPSRLPQERSASTRREPSPDERRRRERSSSRRPEKRSGSTRPDTRERSRTRPAAERRGDHARSKSMTITKELAARELEDRRQSLARRPSAPAIPHPEELFASRSPGADDEAGSMTSWRAASELPPRSKTTAPESSSAPYGLPATPRAMRHPKYMSPEGEDIPAVPEIPQSLPSPPQQAEDQLGQLPPTVYSPRQHPPPRSMSAPIPEEPSSPPPLPAALPTHPAFQHALPPSSRRREMSPNGETSKETKPRKVNGAGSQQPGTLGYETRNAQPVYVGIDETLHARNSDGDMSNPASPPMLPELKHLAVPPPPPPPPAPMRPGHSRANSTSTGVSVGNSSDVISIAIDDTSRGDSHVVDVPMPSQSAQGMRDRPKDESFTGQLRRATMRMRSVSRNRNKSPPIDMTLGRRTASPYESIPLPPQMEIPIRSNTVSPGMERHPREVKAGYTPEMIRGGYMEGGMI
ncbi:MAG: hypothetical protein M1825_005753 [Sarcosagium campestre]|nr:MAG: hypothetical protein M1825_005753 [Sarcosagium campestre]